MLHAIRRRMSEERGFTLIELLVVILIIGILAAIAIPSFLSQKDKAGDASAKSYARNLQTAQETYFTDNNAYTSDIALLRRIEPALNEVPNDTTAPRVTGAARTFAIEVTADSGVVYEITRADTGAITRECAARDTGGCNSAGTW